MIVEFIGSTGAGKTTLARALSGRGEMTPSTMMASELLTDHAGRRWITNPTAINLLAEVTSFPSFVRALRHDRDFVRFSFDRLRRHAPSTVARYNYMRNIVRKVGMHELAKRAAPDATILADEGTLLSSYQLFVYSDAPFTQAELDRFARLVPLPDLVVYVRAPHDALVDRAMARPDRRRELRGRGREEVSDLIARAIELFDRLAVTEPIRSRLLTVEVAEEASGGLEAAVAQVARFVGGREHDHRLAGSPVSSDASGIPGMRSNTRTGGRGVVGVVAFVGSEATGKSTVIGEVQGWLGQHHPVRRIHVGKPPSTPVTWLPHVLLPALRALFPEQRSLKVEARNEGSDRPAERTYPLMFGIRSVMLAYERRALLTRSIDRSWNGTILLCDRYPSRRSGAPDGPQLGHLPTPSGRFSLRRGLAKLEDRLYRGIPAPDLVFHLTAPLEVTLARNAAREKKEPEDYVRFRHTLSATLRFDGSVVRHIDTDSELEGVIEEVKDAIRDAFESGAEASPRIA